MSVGYVPSSRVSIYKLDTFASPWQHHAMDLSADPGKVGTHPNESFLNLGDPVVRATYERRYGPDTAGTRFKTFAGGGNEVKSIWSDALRWWCNSTGTPSEVEVIDALATNAGEIPRAYLVANVPGWREDNPSRINDPLRPHGASHSWNEFWGLMFFEFNDAEQVEPPVDPPVDPPAPEPVTWEPLPADLVSDLHKIASWSPSEDWKRGKRSGAVAAALKGLAYHARQQEATKP